jgi:hypothetical protein
MYCRPLVQFLKSKSVEKQASIALTLSTSTYTPAEVWPSFLAAFTCWSASIYRRPLNVLPHKLVTQESLPVDNRFFATEASPALRDFQEAIQRCFSQVMRMWRKPLFLNSAIVSGVPAS